MVVVLLLPVVVLLLLLLLLAAVKGDSRMLLAAVCKDGVKDWPRSERVEVRLLLEEEAVRKVPALRKEEWRELRDALL